MFRVFRIPSPVFPVFVLDGNKRGQSSSSEVEVWVLTITLFSSTLTVSRASLISLLCLLGALLSSSLLLFRKLQRKLQMLEKRSPRQEHPQSPVKMLHIWGRHSSTTPTSRVCLSAPPAPAAACPFGPPGNSGMPGMEGGGVSWASPTLPSISPAASLLKQECEASIGEFLLLATKSFLPPLAYFLLGLGEWDR